VSLQLGFVEHAQNKLRSVLREIDKLKYSDFPEASVKDSLDLLKEKINKQIARLDSLPPSPTAPTSVETWAKACQFSNLYVARILPVLGFILRSTNVRNAFELHDPVLRLCRSFFGDKVRLVLSSEWDFSPLTYSSVVSELSDYTFIGMPVSEAGNGLIVPLVGHEVAHSIWRNWKLDRKIEDDVRRHVIQEIRAHSADFAAAFTGFDPDTFSTQLFFVEEIKTVTRLSIRQCEEEFCDLVGCRIFGESYLYAFEYLLSPGWGARSFDYLDLPDRASVLVTAAQKWALSIPTGYVSSFLRNPSHAMDAGESLLLSASDGATHRMLPDLIELAEQFCNQGKIALPNKLTADSVHRDLGAGVPSDKAENFVDIVNAGWKAMRDSAFWSDRPTLKNDKMENISQLIFKSIEVSEYKRRTVPPVSSS